MINGIAPTTAVGGATDRTPEQRLRPGSSPGPERPSPERPSPERQGPERPLLVREDARLALDAEPDRPPGPELILSVQLRIGAEPLTPPVARLVSLLEQIATDPKVSTTTMPIPDNGGPSADNAPVRSPDVVRMYSDARSVFRGSREVDLTRREFDLLAYLAAHENQVLTRTQLLAGAWGHLEVGHRSVDVHVRRLRAKIGADLRLVSTIRGVGYRLDGGKCIVERLRKIG
jgi:DNA-binding CsgD family transcriptional regulator